MQKIILQKKKDSQFARQEMIDWWDQEQLTNARIMIVGAGAVGNEVIKNLALLGVGYLFVVDFDTIETSNLSRTVLFKKADIGRKKAEVAARIATELALADNFKVDWFHGDLVTSLGGVVFRQFDLVIGCLDNIEARVAVNKHCQLNLIPWIDGGIKELGVRVNTYQPDQGLCFECNLSDAEFNSIGERYSCFNFKKIAAHEGKVATTQIAAALCAAWQAQEAVKILCHIPTFQKKYIYYQGLQNDFDLIGLLPNKDCPIHKISYSSYQEVDLGYENTVRQLLQNMTEVIGPNPKLLLEGENWSFVISGKCSNCGNDILINKPNYRVQASDTGCDQCSHAKESGLPADKLINHLEYVSFISLKEADYLDFTLKELGFPQGAILTIAQDGSEHQVGLAADVVSILPNLDLC